MLAGVNELRGSEGVYNCSVVGSGKTVWKGSAFDCPDKNDTVNLVHSQFSTENARASGTCNNGMIVGYGIKVEDDCFTSQLNVTVTSDLDGKDIICVHDNGSSELVIGNVTIDVISDTLLNFNNMLIITLSLLMTIIMTMTLLVLTFLTAFCAGKIIIYSPPRCQRIE